ncbi:MAG: trypsin-like serine protease [Candidatus Competibacteraceae bacterium]|nr:trypsin-like serine protease [Candidatus Competibacteraceae bacterium]
MFLLSVSIIVSTSALAAPRIIGGRETTRDVPWVAGLVPTAQANAYAGFFCSGSLIATNWVVTAAHCVENESPDDLDVVVGVHDLEHDLANGIGQRLGVKRIVVNPQWNPATNDADIALLELKQAASYPPIPIYSGQDALVNQAALILGWGKTRPRSWNISPVLLEATLPIITNAVCATALAPETITNNMLCAGYATGGTDTCQGDSGGPLVIDADSNAQLAGITSWGIGCAQRGKYGVYTRVANFTAFIQDSQNRDYFACADINGDGVVDASDQTQKRAEVRNEFAQWQQDCWTPQAACGDVDGDGQVDNADRQLYRRTMRNHYFQWQQSCWRPEQTTP